MTLKDKFDNPIMRHDLGRNEIEETKEQCVEIADEFAIDFAEWCAYYQIGKVGENLWISHLLKMANHYETYTFKQLLNKFKKEKGL